MIHLREVIFPANQQGRGFPFDLPVLQDCWKIQFANPVTFFVGENGSGKSTILEAIALSYNAITIGSCEVYGDKTLGHLRAFANDLSLVWTKKNRKGFFLRAEDFFGYINRLHHQRQDMEEDLQRIEKEYKGRSTFAKMQARSPALSGLSDIKQRYGERGLDGYSHGESFLTLFQNRFVPGGLYLLDEPEVPLSPLRQLSLIAMLKSMVEQESQFIICTHSPILMAFPDARILCFDNGKIIESSYEELEHVNLTRDFLNNPDAFLRHL
jgi:predicted ATPase